MQHRVYFRNRVLPYLLLLPQIAITGIFFFWPAFQAVRQSLYREDPFGLASHFNGLGNYLQVLSNPDYLASLRVTVEFAVAVALGSMAVALLLAVMADQIIRGRMIYRTLLIAPYAIAPAVAGLLWLFILHPAMGTIAWMLRAAGVPWNPVLNGHQALAVVIGAAAWKQISYNFIFFLAGLQAIPKSFLEAAAIDGAGAFRRFRTIIFPLLSPTTFFLLVVDTVYALFETFGIIDAVTQGGPDRATETLVYKVYVEGFVNLRYGESSAQSVILMGIVALLTIVQFRFVERKVHYA